MVKTLDVSDLSIEELNIMQVTLDRIRERKSPWPTKSLPIESEEERRVRGKAMADALRSLVGSEFAASIPDPVAWQREIRKDRSLPGREE